jgi:hypothetical protein
MHWHYLQKFSPSSFKRATGVQKEVFLELVDIVDCHKRSNRKHPNSGSKSILDTPDIILLMLMYYREYRTLFHIGICYGLSESRTCELIRETELIIIKDSRYHLSGKKQLLRTDSGIEVAIVDVSECSIERPKKNKEITIQGRRNAIPTRRNWL